MASIKFISLTLFSIFTLAQSYSQNTPDKSAVIAHIKQVYRQVNDYKHYKVVNIDDAEEFLGHGTDNGGSLTGYYKGDSLKKIVLWVGLSNRVVQQEFYFDKGRIVFVYSTDKTYKFNDSTEEFDYSKFDKVITGRYYFNNDKLIDTILSDKELEKTKQDDAADFIATGKDYVLMLKAKKK